MFDYQAPAALLKDKIILVTGAGDGIGKSAALHYAKHGATVILLGRTTSKLEAVYDQIDQLGYPQAAIVPLNLDGAAEHDFQELAITLEKEFGQLDGILHNASLLGDRTHLIDYNPNTFEQVMRVNVSSQLLLTQALYPLINRSSQGRIIFTSSGVGRTARPNWGAYAISKFATEAMMQLLAGEVASDSNIRINAINPGATRTSMRASAYPDENPLNLPNSDDIMPLYLFLMGKDSQNINGQSLNAQ
ncbi:YciK family oxidoreductase [Marinomonas epiphytica]